MSYALSDDGVITLQSSAAADPSLVEASEALAIATANEAVAAQTRAIADAVDVGSSEAVDDAAEEAADEAADIAEDVADISVEYQHAVAVQTALDNPDMDAQAASAALTDATNARKEAETALAEAETVSAAALTEAQELVGLRHPGKRHHHGDDRQHPG